MGPSSDTERASAPLRDREVDELRREVERLRARLERERLARAQAEQITEDATAQLYEANQDLEAFVANAAHDLRTPVIAIQGFTDLLARELEGRGDETTDLALDRISTNTAFLSDVLSDLLALAAAARDGAAPVTTDPDEVVTAVVADLDQRYPGARIDTGPVPPVAVEPGDFRRLLTNLLGNALAYGGADVQVTLEARTEGEQVVVTVADDGPGVPTADRDRIFEPFVRGGGHDRTSGTGLGLSISRRICRQAGGDIRLADSEKGATFVVTLPAPS